MKTTTIILALLIIFCAGAVWPSERRVARAEVLPANTIIGEAEPPTLLDQFNYVPTYRSVFAPQVVQVGVECVAVPQCPDCTTGGNVCRGVREFYGGLLGAAVAKKMIISACQKANALDYCGGSRGCMKLSLADQKRHRQSYGGGCYPQCQSVAKCVVQYRNP